MRQKHLLGQVRIPVLVMLPLLPLLLNSTKP